MDVRRARWPHGLALIAILWATLSPAMARVLLPAAQEGIEICTSTGVVRVSISTGASADTAPADGPTATSGGCDWCQWQTATVALPPTSPLPVFARVADSAAPEGADAHGPGPLRWSHPAPRAPPVLLPA
ncbi:DUF2946 domain-containing protein [Tepidimonas charontis]|nr:DUF2946 domain-containing protein [Tepidimonas charontis]